MWRKSGGRESWERTRARQKGRKGVGEAESKKRGDKSETSGEKAGCRKGARREILFFFLEHVRSFRQSIGETIVARRTLRDCWTDIFVFPFGLFFFWIFLFVLFLFCFCESLREKRVAVASFFYSRFITNSEICWLLMNKDKDESLCTNNLKVLSKKIFKLWLVKFLHTIWNFRIVLFIKRVAYIREELNNVIIVLEQNCL